MTTFNYDSPSVHNYINILQSIISRMATNSASVKTWCITLVSAVMVFAADKSKPEAAWIAIIPILLCFSLDSYYLGLERMYRGIYNSFIQKLMQNVVSVNDLFVLSPIPNSFNTLRQTINSMYSFSTLPFYGLLVLMIAIYKTWIA